MKKVELEQGTTAWLDFRKKMVTASQAPIILGLSTYQTPYGLWLEKTDAVEPQEPNKAMLLGSRIEGPTRDWYNNLYSVDMRPAVCVHHNGWLMASLDGILDNASAILEIKLCNKKRFLDAKECIVWPDHEIQLQIQLECVQEADYCDYLCVNHLGEATREIRVHRRNIDMEILKLHEFWLSINIDQANSG